MKLFFLWRQRISISEQWDDRKNMERSMITQNAEQPREDVYEFRVEGYLRPEWSGWLDGLEISHEEGGVTVLSGPVADQAALHGLLAKIRDLNLKLIALRNTG
jgi:hypothetical protein